MVALAFLMPIVASMGGNAGMQTLAVTVRAIATNDLTENNFSQNIIKEFSIGILNGLIFAINKCSYSSIMVSRYNFIINNININGFKYDSCWFVWNINTNKFKKNLKLILQLPQVFLLQQLLMLLVFYLF